MVQAAVRIGSHRMNTNSKHTLPENYAVDCNGSVISFSGWRGTAIHELKPALHRGYLCVRVVTSSGKRVRRMVHQLVMHYYGADRPSALHEIRHLDGNPLNNHIRNLAWGTKKDNAADRDTHGRTSRGAAHSAAIKASTHRQRVVRGADHHETKRRIANV